MSCLPEEIYAAAYRPQCNYDSIDGSENIFPGRTHRHLSCILKIKHIGR